MRGARVLMDRDGDALKTFDPGPLKKGGKKEGRKKKSPRPSRSHGTVRSGARPVPCPHTATKEG